MKAEDSRPFSDWKNLVPVVTSIIAFVIGVLVFVAWAQDIEWIKNLNSNWITMKVNTALLFILISIPLFFASLGRLSKLVMLFVISVEIFAVLSLLQYFLPVNLGIDEFLFKDLSAGIATASPGRPAAATLINFMLLGFSLWFGISKNLRRTFTSQILALLAGFIVLDCGLIYLYQLPTYPSITGETQMAIHTIFAQLLLAVGILFLHPDRDLMSLWLGKSYSSKLARKMTLAIVGLPLVVITIRAFSEYFGMVESGPKYSESASAVFVTASGISIILAWYFWKNITHLQDMERDLRISEMRKASVINGSLDCIISMDQYGKIIEFNTAAEKTFGYRREDVLGKDMADLIIPPHLRGAHRHGLSYYLQSGLGPVIGKRIELAAIKADGTEFDIELSIIALDLSGEIVFTGFLRDISDQIKTKLQLVEQNERTKSVLNHIADGIITIGEDFKIESWNVAAEKLFGYLAPEVIGQNVSILMPEPFRSQHDSYVTNYLTTGIAKIIGIGREVVGQRKDGSEFPMDLAISEFRLGGKRYFTGIVRDITERKNAEEDLHLAKEAAEDANEAKSAFLANMSHELRTPLGAVLGFSDLLTSSDVYLSPTERSNYKSAIKRNGELLTNIINDILDLSKVEAGKLELDVRDVDLQEIFMDINSLLGLQAKEKGIQLNMYVSGQVPRFIRTDPMRLRQILFNIVGNAIKFTDKGSINITAKCHESHLEISVKDTGRGLTSEQTKKLFQPFSQADATVRRRFGGTGLGLILSRRIARLMGGDVQLTESTPNNGSTFTIKVEFTALGNPLMLRFQSDQRGLSGDLRANVRLEGANILLVEDSIDNQILISKLLTHLGAQVDVADNGLIAVEKAQSGNYNLVLMDIQMPVMDGYDAVAKLRNSGYKVPIIALTAHAMKEEREKCLARGFNDHISKPIDIKHLILVVSDYCKIKNNNSQKVSKQDSPFV